LRSVICDSQFYFIHKQTASEEEVLFGSATACNGSVVDLAQQQKGIVRSKEKLMPLFLHVPQLNNQLGQGKKTRNSKYSKPEFC
jgi:hypothetical protein